MINNKAGDNAFVIHLCICWFVSLIQITRASRIKMRRPENWESLLCRLTRHEPALGCFDTNGLVERRVDSRDMADILVSISDGSPPTRLSLACFLAHLVHPDSLYPWMALSSSDDDADDVEHNDITRDPSNKVREQRDISIIRLWPGSYPKCHHNDRVIPINVNSSSTGWRR